MPVTFLNNIPNKGILQISYKLIPPLKTVDKKYSNFNAANCHNSAMVSSITAKELR
jgi:hypothetical protein